jgi:pimeloyl-ACP methyl ester carboxylesterase
MLVKYLAAFIASFGLAAAAPAVAEGGGYAPVNGLRVYYEVQGAGRPLVLLHGGVCTIESCMANLRRPLADGWTTIAIEQQGHGRTADIDRPLRYAQMVEDTAAVLRHLKVENADVVGYSMGGGIALRLAMRHRELVRKVVVIGTAYADDGLVPGLTESFKVLKPEDVPAAFREAYARVAPDPSRWPALVEKIMGLMVDADALRADDLRSIKAPTLVMVGDADIVRPEHAVEMFRLLPHAQLAVVPGADHFAPMAKSDWVAGMARAFLEAPMPEAK